jgi:DNA invertase Pin-like site-specific DNA recombinase
MKIGYARTSSVGQKNSIETQIAQLKAVGCDKIFTEQKSGKQVDNRKELKVALDFCREGDTFIVTRLDRCSRSVKDLHTIIDQLNNKNVNFKATEQELDTTTSAGRLMIGLLSIVSAFETDLRAERQADGIKSALEKGIKFGKKAINLSDEEIQKAIKLKEQGKTSQEVATNFGISRSTLLKKIKEYKER